MKAENQVCTLEQAKRLKELGVAQESYFGFRFDFLAEQFYVTSEKCSGDIAAFSVAELGVMLPAYFQSWLGNDEMGEVCWVCEGDGVIAFEKTEAQVRALTLITLLGTGHVTASECNTRLQS